MSKKYWEPWESIGKSCRFTPTKESMDRINQFNPSRFKVENILDKIDIKEIEKYLRKKKLERLKGE